MGDDIVTRLRQIGDELSEDYYPTVYDAAREIERLRAANAALRFELADIRRGIDHDPAKCALLSCQRCDPWDDRRG